MLNIPKQYSSLKYLRPLKWRDIFDVWREGESHQKMWREHWQARGFSSWEEWRENYVAPLVPEELDWNLFEIKDPLQEFLLIYGTPTRGWIAKCYGGETTKQLKDVFSHPIITNNKKIKEIAEDFPENTMLTGIINDQRIVLVEGMHRACALAIMAREGKQFRGDVKIALAEFSGQIPSLGKGDNI